MKITLTSGTPGISAEELHQLMTDAQAITEDVGSYFFYCKTRTEVLQSFFSAQHHSQN